MVRRTLFTVVNARWTASNEKLLVFEPQWIKNTERAKQLLIPPVYYLRGIRAYDELQIVVTEVGQVKRTVTFRVSMRSRDDNITSWHVSQNASPDVKWCIFVHCVFILAFTRIKMFVLLVLNVPVTTACRTVKKNRGKCKIFTKTNVLYRYSWVPSWLLVFGRVTPFWHYNEACGHNDRPRDYPWLVTSDNIV